MYPTCGFMLFIDKYDYRNSFKLKIWRRIKWYNYFRHYYLLYHYPLLYRHTLG
jgi:hypothetical protein